MKDKIKQINLLVDELNKASSMYYNGITSPLTDKEWDEKFDLLVKLEKETGYIAPNSPTNKVGYEVLSEIPKVKLTHPMLSLAKCHTVEEVKKFAQGKPIVGSIKLDGLSVSLTYRNGKLMGATTRGNGEIGSDISSHIKYFMNVPKTINKQGIYIIDGECIIFKLDFENINVKLPEEEQYANPRNLAAGSLNQLDMSIVKERCLNFIAWRVIEGGSTNSFFDNMIEAKRLGFDTVIMTKINDSNLIESTINGKKEYAEQVGIPIDGVVFTFDDIEYGMSLGRTGHHYNYGIAYKFKDDCVETTLLDIEYSMGKTGDLTPVAIFEPVELEGTTVSRASLHNISICEDLELGIGDIITVFKANQIIPQIKDNITRNGYKLTIDRCPICGGSIELQKDNDTEVLKCLNPNCQGKLLGKLNHFVSKNALDIKDMSEATLQFLIDKEWITCFEDLYNLDVYYDEWVKTSGFGKKSVDNLLKNIQTSQNTSFARFLYALSIPLIGRTASKAIAKVVEEKDGNPYLNFTYLLDIKFDWTTLNDFGNKMNESVSSYYKEHKNEMDSLAKLFNFEVVNNSGSFTSLNGKTFVITGSVNHWTNRDELKNYIESLGGKVAGSVSAKTDYLINNDITSTSGKNKKMKELGKENAIISEEDFIKMIS